MEAVSPGFWWAQGSCLKGSQLAQSGEHGLHEEREKIRWLLAALLQKQPRRPRAKPEGYLAPDTY